MRLVGKVWKFGRNVNTDLIYPKLFFKALYEPGEVGSHLMAGIDAEFSKKVSPGDMIVAEPNFGCGSSREEAAGGMREAGIAAVIAPSFGRLFTRNCINLGVPVVTSEAIDEHVNEGDTLEIDLSAGTLRNLTSGYETKLPKMASESLAMIEAGGIKPYTKKTLTERMLQADGRA